MKKMNKWFNWISISVIAAVVLIIGITTFTVIKKTTSGDPTATPNVTLASVQKEAQDHALAVILYKENDPYSEALKVAVDKAYDKASIDNKKAVKVIWLQNDPDSKLQTEAKTKEVKAIMNFISYGYYSDPDTSKKWEKNIPTISLYTSKGYTWSIDDPNDPIKGWAYPELTDTTFPMIYKKDGVNKVTNKKDVYVDPAYIDAIFQNQWWD